MPSFVDNCSQVEATSIGKSIAKFFFKQNILFAKIESEEFINLVTALRPAYAKNYLYGATTLRTKMLDTFYEAMKNDVEQVLTNAPYYTIVTDGWESLSRQHLGDIMIHTPGANPIYYKSVNTTKQSLNSQKLSEILVEVATELGVDKWLTIVTDNASVNIAAGKIIEDLHPKVFVLGCDTHNYNLLIKDISNPQMSSQIAEVIETANHIINLFLNHRAVRVPFEETRKKFEIRRGLHQPCETRFATNVIMLQSLFENQLALIEVVYKHKEAWTNLKPDTKRMVQ